MKTLSINGKFLSQEITGVQRYAAEIVKAWDNSLETGFIDRKNYAIRVITPCNIRIDPGYRHILVEKGSTNGRFWEQIELPWRARGTLLFSPYAAAPLFKMRHATTIHDAGAAATPHQYSLSFRAYCFVAYRVLGNSCRPVFTVSEFSKQELRRYFSIPENRMRVIPPGCDHLLRIPPDPGILAQNGLGKGSYVLAVSSHSIIKNFAGLSEAVRRLSRPGLKLAVAGASRNHLFGAGATDIHEGIVSLGYVTDGQLRSLYESAALFAYPSFYEGFGIPPVEAMSCGCPVLAASSTALPEACGDAAAYCDPADVNDIARGIARVLDDRQFADTLREKGRTRARGLTAQRAAAQLWSELVKYI